MKLVLFDVDGTLAESTMSVSQEIIDMLRIINTDDCHLGIVGGGDYAKIVSQLGEEHLPLFKYIFSENGLVSYRDQEKFHARNIRDAVPERRIQDIVNCVLKYIAEIDLPYKRGGFIRFRNGMMYVTPMGGDCSAEERAQFVEYDATYNVRRRMIAALKVSFPDMDIILGGAIGFGIHPRGWDKSYIMQFISIRDYDSITFYGDRCEPDGNDYPLYSNPNIDGVWVTGPEDTRIRAMAMHA
jgi:phosphomannomutase